MLEEKEKQYQPFKIHLRETGELKVEGTPSTPEESEYLQQILDESHSRAKAYEKIHNLTKWESFYQGIIGFSVFMLLLFVVSFVAVRTVSQAFNNTQGVQSNVR